MTVFITKTLYILPEIISEYDFQTSLFPIFSLSKLKVSRSRNKIVELKISHKKQTNEFVFLSWTVIRTEKQIRSFVFLGESADL